MTSASIIFALRISSTPSPFVSKGWPVMALMNNDEAVLILGFENQKSVEILEPRIGSVHGLGMAEAEEWFKQNGNHFITYIPYEK